MNDEINERIKEISRIVSNYKKSGKTKLDTNDNELIKSYFLNYYLPKSGEEKIKEEEIKYFKVDKHPEYDTYCIIIVTTDGKDVPCNKKNLAGAKYFINSENQSKFDENFTTKKSRVEYLDNLIEKSRGKKLSGVDDFYVRYMYATCLSNRTPFYNHEIQYFKIDKPARTESYKSNFGIVLVKFDKNKEIPIQKKELAGKKDKNKYMRHFIEDQIAEFKLKNPCPGDNYEVNHKKQFSEIYKEFLVRENIESDNEFILSTEQQNSWKEYHKKIIGTDEGALEWLSQDDHKKVTRDQAEKRKLENNQVSSKNLEKKSKK